MSDRLASPVERFKSATAIARERAYNRGWADGNASALDACNPIIADLQASVVRLQQALRVASHEPHDQVGDPVEGFPVCSVCGAIQVDDGQAADDEDWTCIDCGIPLEPGAPPICSECVEDGG